MSGQAAAAGFEYQFLCTLSYALRGLIDADDWLTGIIVDAPPSDDLHVDQEIVDFALLRGDRCALVAQVKGGALGSTMSAADAVRVLLRLLTHDADKYALITNRRAGAGLLAIIAALKSDDARELIAAQLSRTPEVQRAVLSADTTWVRRLSRVQIVLDDRSVDELRVVVREQVRAARRHIDPTNAGWDAAGLLTGYLTAEVLARAASAGAPMVDRASLVEALQINPNTLRSLAHERDWAVPLTALPRATDIARPDVLSEIGGTLLTPVQGNSVPICVLTGLSGIGKTGVATAWVEDRADAYANILWVDAGTSAQIEGAFAEAAVRLTGHKVGAGSNARDVVHDALARSALPWLVVFDNAVSLRAIRQWLPTSGLGHVLVTTVDPTAVTGPNVASVTVTAMTEEQAVTLLSARLLPERTSTTAETRVMHTLARRLQCWPLALELAATYLNDCLGGLRGIDAYETLIMRSLDDEDSVPLGYPYTLVRAVQLAWQRMVDQPSEAGRLALDATRYASLLAPRRIPIHLLLSACLIEPRELVEDGVERGLRIYYGPEPPLGEVLRAMQRQSLVTVDAPRLKEQDGGESDDLSVTVAINEIVQTILRNELHKSGHFDGILSRAAFHAQYWLSYFADKDDLASAMRLTAHAVTVADHALVERSMDYTVALLLGNTARMLNIMELHDLAVRYLRAELEILERCQGDQSLLRLQTASSLAFVLYEGAERPRDVADEIADALEEVVKHVSSAYDIDQDITAHTIRGALAAVANLIHDGGGVTHRIEQLRIALEQYCKMMPLHGRPDLVEETKKIGLLIKGRKYKDAVSKVNSLLEAPGIYSMEKNQLLRLRLECHVWLEDWEWAFRELLPFLDAAAADRLRVNDVATVSRNVGFAALQVLTPRVEESVAVFRQAVELANIFENHGRRMQAHDQVVLDLFRCVDAVLVDDVNRVVEFLARIDLNELEKQKSVILDALYRLLVRWVEVAPRWSTLPRLKSADEVRRQVKTPTLDEVLEWVAGTPIRWRPLMAASVSQAHLGVASISDSFQATAVDLVRVLELLGFPGEVVGTACAVGLPERPEEELIVKESHYVVYSEYFGRLVDPGAPSLIADIDGLPESSIAIPSVISISGPDQLEAGAAVLTKLGVVIFYNGCLTLESKNSRSDSMFDPLSRAEPFLIALKAITALAACGDCTELFAIHPQLEGLVPADLKLD